MKEYLMDAQQVLAGQGVTPQGLTSSQAAERLEHYGKNKLEEGKKATLLQRFLKELADPMIIILIAAAAVSGVTAAYSGDSFADVIIILAVVIINAVLGVMQESKAEKAIAALQEIAASSSKMLRDGRKNMTYIGGTGVLPYLVIPTFTPPSAPGQSTDPPASC